MSWTGRREGRRTSAIDRERRCYETARGGVSAPLIEWPTLFSTSPCKITSGPLDDTWPRHVQLATRQRPDRSSRPLQTQLGSSLFFFPACIIFPIHAADHPFIWRIGNCRPGHKCEVTVLAPTDVITLALGRSVVHNVHHLCHRVNIKTPPRTPLELFERPFWFLFVDFCRYLLCSLRLDFVVYRFSS